MPRICDIADGAKIAAPLMNLGTVAHHGSGAHSRRVNSSVDAIKPPRQVPRRGGFLFLGRKSGAAKNVIRSSGDIRGGIL